jgi:hypothetical protein
LKTARIAGAAAALLVMVLTGCASNTPAPAPAPTSPTQATTQPATTPAPTGAGAALNLDPCKLVTAQQASALTGGNYSSGQAETDSSSSKRCLYGPNTPNYLIVVVVQGSSPAEAQSYKDALKAEAQAALQGQPVTMTQLSGVGDDAVSLSANLMGGKVQLNGVYALKGAVGVALIHTAVSYPVVAMPKLIAQMQTVLGSLP